MSDIDTLKQCERNDDLASVDVIGLMELLPHRPPLLMIDGLYNIVTNESAVGLKAVTMNEPFFVGHFPGHPVMPGVLIIEAMAQAAGLLTQLSDPPRPPDAEQPVYYLVKVDKARFSRIVVPGDQLSLEVEQKRMLRRMGLYDCRALVAGEVVASAEILCAEQSP
jgi:3-hydroxyacyl-[acyl-carrier-protein] dehydratase